jgi:TPR repeat protein
MKQQALPLALALALFSPASLNAQAQNPPGSVPVFVQPRPNLPPVPGVKDAEPVADDPAKPKPDLAFAAFQRGYYVTALREANKRIADNPNDAPALTLMGELYRTGLGVRRDLTVAASYYKLAMDRGDTPAAFALGRAYLEGAGVEKDLAKAQQAFEKAAINNHAGALYNLGVMAMDANIADFPKAAEYFRRASEQGDNDATYALAMLYKEGTGVAKDRQKAVQLLKVAAEEQHISSMVDYAIAVFNGDGVEKDESLAGKFFLRAAGRENPIAQNRIARMLANGRGVRLDMIEAMKWHILARAAGIQDDYLDGLLNAMSPQQRQNVENAVRKFIGN